MVDAAIRSNPNVVLISEEVAANTNSLAQVVETISNVVAKRSSAGKDWGVLIFGEGFVEAIPEVKVLLSELQTQSGIANPEQVPLRYVAAIVTPLR